MVRHPTSIGGYFIASLFLHWIGCFLLSTVILVISIGVAMPSILPPHFSAENLFYYLMLTSGLGFISYLLLSFIFALIISAILARFPSKFGPLISSFLAMALLYILSHNLSDRRDLCITISGMVGFAITSIIVQRVLPSPRTQNAA